MSLPPPPPCPAPALLSWSSSGDYQRLEFLGDALLDYMCMAHFFTMHPGWDPGRLTAEKSALVGNSFLAWVAADQLLVHKFMYYDR